MFLSVQKISRVVEREYNGTSLTISMQAGLLFFSVSSSLASPPEKALANIRHLNRMVWTLVPHCHVHVIPRKVGDYTNNDDIYKDIDKSTRVDNEERQPRSLDEMAKEASFLRQFFE
ncbi:5992_t:CDS:2, partial [Acaulospora morrowiae]